MWSWWAWEQGGYFETVWLPGTLLLCAGTVIVLVVGDAGGRPPVAALVAIGALAALGAWSILSALWSPAPETAVADGQRILMYALAFGLGNWAARRLGPRVVLCLIPLAVAAGFAAVATAVAMIGADAPGPFVDNGTLEKPIGYRNANAAFFLIALFPGVGLAAYRDLDWRLRGLALATATMSLGLAMLSQSRASVPAAAAALAVYLLLSPLRARALSWLLLAALPALAVLPVLLDLFEVAKDDSGAPRATILRELEDTGLFLAAAGAISLALGLTAARLDGRLPALGQTTARWNRAVAGGLAALCVAAAGAFTVSTGDPAGWIGDRIDEFRYEDTPDTSERTTRFTVSAGSNRYDFWRVALDDLREDPLLGEGGGGFQYSYLRSRDSQTDARDAHSVELEVAAELGIPGLILLLAALAAAVVAAVRARRAGTAAATLTAIALACATYWILHASVDWFWTYAGVTAPALALLGSAAGTGPRRDGRRPAVTRAVLAILVAALALTTIPPFLSARYVDAAFEGWRSDTARAYDDLERAHDLNPLADLPFLAAGAIARAAGDRDRALSALREAIEKKPEEFAGHYLIADLEAGTDRREARARAATALELNPRDPQVRELADDLGLRVPAID